MRCSNCGSENPVRKKFCGDCGAALGNLCAQCGVENPLGKQFCGDCGAPLTGSAQTGPGGARRLTPANRQDLVRADAADSSLVTDGERKTVTALFADIKGSMELIEDLDPEEARAIVDPALKLMIDTVQRYDGHIVQSTGDGIFALFGAPVAHEDHPQRALYAALRMQAEIHRYGDRMRAQGQTPLQVRIGSNTGEVVVRSLQTGTSQPEYTPIGHSTSLAARLQTLATPGSTVISGSTRRFVEGYFQLKGLGKTAVKGVSEPVELFEVTGLGPLRTRLQAAAWRGLTRFIGRDTEMAQMRRALELARQGHGQIVAAMGDPGVGKSRLFFEFKAVSETGCLVLEAYSVSHGKASAYLPVIELLRDYFHIEAEDDERRRREKIAGRVLMLERSFEDTLPYIFTLMGVHERSDPFAQRDHQVGRRRTQEAIKRILLRESLNQPLIVIFEDLHWIDGETQAFLNVIVDAIANSRILLLVNYRPEYRHEWGNRTYYTQMRLDPLKLESANEMLTTLLGTESDLAPLRRLIAERTEGNPFFIEEMVRALFEQGTVAHNGTVKLMRPLTEVKVPATVQAVLASRIDRLPADEKQLLQTLAIIGREFRLQLGQRVAGCSEAELEQLLASLQSAEFIYEQPAFPDPEYVFKHALTQQVAYNSMLLERRKILHERAGQALESMFSEQLDAHVSELARHYSSSDNISKAVDYLNRAGQQALQRCAPSDATGYLVSAIDLLRKLSDNAGRIQRELQLQMTLGSAFILLSGWAAPEVEQAFTRALAICEHLGNPPEVFFALFGLNSNSHVRGDYCATRERSRELLRLAHRTGDHTHLVLAHYAMNQMAFHTGELKLAREHQERLLVLYDQERDHPLALRIGVDCKDLSYTGRTLWFLGYPDKALRTGQEAVAFARGLSHPNSVASAEFFLNIVQIYRREASSVQTSAERIIAFCSEHGFGAWLLFSTHHRGWAIAEQGRFEEGIALMREGLARAHAAGADIVRTDLLCHLAEVCMKASLLDDAVQTINEALATVERQEERYYEPDIYRVRGEVLLRRDRTNKRQAEDCFGRAIEIARKQSGKSLELRATTSLARLLEKEGRRAEAHTMLAEIYNWFTEGFDTADLKEAKALLDDLSG